MNFREKYQILQEIGRGTYSVVYLVNNKLTDTIAVAKRAREPEYSQNLRGEAEILKQLEISQGVVEFIETIPDERCNFPKGNRAIILKYAGQQCLARFLKKHNDKVDSDINPRFNQRELSFYAAQLIAGISHLHAHGYIHGDLKPGNIIRGDHVLRKGDHIRIIDFSGCRHFFEVRNCYGTPGYQAPEQKHGVTEFNTDYYGIGITLNALAQGRVRSIECGDVKITTRNDITDKFKEGLYLTMHDNSDLRQKGLHLLL
ncbi:protein kinase [Candidatus Woesearchaeota archaeon]|nr:protein kinase [Candidatus Woesearchaeota archaeon]